MVFSEQKRTGWKRTNGQEACLCFNRNAVEIAIFHQGVLAMSVQLIGIDNKAILEVGITGPEDARTLAIATGVAKFAFRGTGMDFVRSSVLIPTGVQIDDPTFQNFRGATATASLASIANDGVANNAGWAVDSVDVPGFFPPPGELTILVYIAVRDTDGFLLRVMYQANVLLTRAPRPS
jgi:hypothetical protein